PLFNFRPRARLMQIGHLADIMSVAPGALTTRMTMPRKHATVYAAIDPVKIAAQIERGLPVSHLVRFQKQSRLPLGLLAYAIQVPERTLRRRLSQKRLPADESDRLFRFAS